LNQQFIKSRTESLKSRFIRHCIKGGKKRGACDRIYLHDPYYTPFSLSRPYFDAPRPQKPTLESETQRIVKASCSNNCACDKNYRLCYTSCGGVVKSRKVCVKNCN